MKNNSKILTLICFGVIVLSMFLPFFEGPRDGIVIAFPFSLIKVYDSVEFNLRMFVFNGFGSFFALTNLLIAIVLLLSRLFFPKSLVTAILTSLVFLISLVMLMRFNEEGYKGAPLPDEMLYGFYLMLISQVILIAQCYTKAITEPPKGRTNNPDLLDF